MPVTDIKSVITILLIALFLGMILYLQYDMRR
jgi:hypothetical protein